MEDNADNYKQLVYRFGITSILEKKEALLSGDKVRNNIFLISHFLPSAIDHLSYFQHTIYSSL